MTSRREWYQRTEETWPEGPLPSLTAEEAVRAGRKLWRFMRGNRNPLTGMKRKIPKVVATSGRRYSGFVWRDNVRVLLVNPDRGWKALVHELSHELGGGHSKKHARLEARMIREVLRRGWLDGVLDRERPPEPAQGNRDAKILEQIDAGILRWSRKKKRAETAIRKLEKRRKYYRAKLAHPQMPGDYFVMPSQLEKAA